jgi:hypothetical protein
MHVRMWLSSELYACRNREILAWSPRKREGQELPVHMNSSHLTPLVYSHGILSRQGLEDSVSQEMPVACALDGQGIGSLNPESAESLAEETFIRLQSGPASPFG